MFNHYPEINTTIAAITPTIGTKMKNENGIKSRYTPKKNRSPYKIETEKLIIYFPDTGTGINIVEKELLILCSILDDPGSDRI